MRSFLSFCVLTFAITACQSPSTPSQVKVEKAISLSGTLAGLVDTDDFIGEGDPICAFVLNVDGQNDVIVATRNGNRQPCTDAAEQKLNGKRIAFEQLEYSDNLTRAFNLETEFDSAKVYLAAESLMRPILVGIVTAVVDTEDFIGEGEPLCALVLKVSKDNDTVLVATSDSREACSLAVAQGIVGKSVSINDYLFSKNLTVTFGIETEFSSADVYEFNATSLLTDRD
jgi:hypothetical protein